MACQVVLNRRELLTARDSIRQLYDSIACSVSNLLGEPIPGLEERSFCNCVPDSFQQQSGDPEKELSSSGLGMVKCLHRPQRRLPSDSFQYKRFYTGISMNLVEINSLCANEQINNLSSDEI
jgi:hypothetical protein